MAIDTPATIAIIGAGPVGLEAALYARFLGYDVQVYERGRVVGRLHEGTEEAAVAWSESTSPLGIAALAAQTPGWQPSAVDERFTPAQMALSYFEPLAATDLLVDSIITGCEVVGIERDIEPDAPPAEEDDVIGFRLRVRGATGETPDAGERIERADVVIDTSGLRAPSFGIAPSELDFYILGSKSSAEPGRFHQAGEISFVDSLAQIRALFAILADRADLDLYASVSGSLSPRG